MGRRINLTARQYHVHTASNGAAAVRATAEDHPDLVILDLGLPDIDGLAVIRQLRSWTPVPIIVLSGRTGSTDKVDALDAGADDYVTKPFSIDELLARIRSITRRQTTVDRPATVRVGRFLVDLDRHHVESLDRDGETVHLTRTEWELLEALITEPGKLIS